MKRKAAMMEAMTWHVDGDFDPDFPVECEFLCSPTCHPAQVGPDWKYGCKNPKHQRYDKYGFVPIVDCMGVKDKCEIHNWSGVENGDMCFLR